MKDTRKTGELMARNFELQMRINEQMDQYVNVNRKAEMEQMQRLSSVNELLIELQEVQSHLDEDGCEVPNLLSGPARDAKKSLTSQRLKHELLAGVSKDNPTN